MKIEDRLKNMKDTEYIRKVKNPEYWLYDL